MVDTATVQPGESESWEYEVGREADVEVQADNTPYAVDIEEKRSPQPDSAYERVEQFTTFYGGTKSVTTTSEKRFTLTALAGTIRVTITNNSGVRLTPTVAVSPPDANPQLREDGKLMQDVKELLSELVDAEKGDITLVNTDELSLGDDDLQMFGTDDDFGIEYESANDKLVVTDQANSIDLLRFQKNDKIELPNEASVSGVLELLLTGGNLTLTGSNETADGMTANPESAAEDGFITIDIGANSYQIPIYTA